MKTDMETPLPCLNPVDFLPRDYSKQFSRTSKHQYCKSIANAAHVLLSKSLCVIFYVAVFVFAAYSYNISLGVFKKVSQYPLYSDKNIQFDEESNPDKLDKLSEQVGGLLMFQAMVEKEIYKDGKTISMAQVESKIEDALAAFQADSIGLVDYASKKSGGSISSLNGTSPYPIPNKSVRMFIFFEVPIMSQPENLLDPDNTPGNCFAFHGTTGSIHIKLGKPVLINAVTMDSAPFAFLEVLSHTPREFAVYGLDSDDINNGILLGTFEFSLKGKPTQTFPINPIVVKMYEYVELRILSNHGSPICTCVYQFRVHSLKKFAK